MGVIGALLKAGASHAFAQAAFLDNTLVSWFESPVWESIVYRLFIFQRYHTKDAPFKFFDFAPETETIMFLRLRFQWVLNDPNLSCSSGSASGTFFRAVSNFFLLALLARIFR